MRIPKHSVLFASLITLTLLFVTPKASASSVPSELKELTALIVSNEADLNKIDLAIQKLGALNRDKEFCETKFEFPYPTTQGSPGTLVNVSLVALATITPYQDTKILKKIIDYCSKSGADWTETSKDWPALHDAIDKGSFDKFKLRLQTSGFSVESALSEDQYVLAPSNIGMTLLMRAACVGNEELFKLLLDKGASLASGDKKGWTWLRWAYFCKSGTFEGNPLKNKTDSIIALAKDIGRKNPANAKLLTSGNKEKFRFYFLDELAPSVKLVTEAYLIREFPEITSAVEEFVDSFNFLMEFQAASKEALNSYGDFEKIKKFTSLASDLGVSQKDINDMFEDSKKLIEFNKKIFNTYLKVQEKFLNEPSIRAQMPNYYSDILQNPHDKLYDSFSTIPDIFFQPIANQGWSQDKCKIQKVPNYWRSYIAPFQVNGSGSKNPFSQTSVVPFIKIKRIFEISFLLNCSDD